jgi:ABC-2 type transport system permease protein
MTEQRRVASAANGVWIVARQEFRIRIRTGRWRWLLIGWLVLLAGFTLLLDAALTSTSYSRSDNREGVALFGFTMVFVLAMVLVISPSLTAQAINGDRERGTLAALQVTMLRPLHIALGKLLAGWGVGLAALAITLPFTGYAMAKGGIGVLRVIAIYLVVATLIGTICAISLALSALMTRTVTSTLLSYLAVAALTIGTTVGFALSLPLVTSSETMRYPDGSESTRSESHQEFIWWLLAPNPFVVVADAAPPISSGRYRGYYNDDDVLELIGNGVRGLRAASSSSNGAEADDLPVWPYGLGFNLLLGIGSIAIVQKRLRTPTDRLPPATRIA